MSQRAKHTIQRFPAIALAVPWLASMLLLAGFIAKGTDAPPSRPVLPTDQVRDQSEAHTGDRLQRWRGEVTKAEQAARVGDIPLAQARAASVVAAIRSAGLRADSELASRLSSLERLGDALAEARRIRGEARGQIEPALSKLANLEKRYAVHNDLDGTLRQLIEEFGTIIREDARAEGRMKPEELLSLAEQAGKFIERVGGEAVVGRLTVAQGQQVRYGTHRLAIRYLGPENRRFLVFELNGHRFKIDDSFWSGESGGQEGVLLLRQRPTLLIDLLLNLEKRLHVRGVPAGLVWTLHLEAPYASATVNEGSRTLFFCDGRLYTGRRLKSPIASQTVLAELATAVDNLAQAVEKDEKTPEDVRKVVLPLIRGAAKELPSNYQLPIGFCRAALNEGYLEANLPGVERRFGELLRKYREAFARVSTLAPRFRGWTMAGNEAEWLCDHTGRRVYRFYDQSNDTTTFGLNCGLDWYPMLHGTYQFPGQVASLPDCEPTKAGLAHPLAGVLAVCNPATGTLVFDTHTWNEQVQRTTYDRSGLAFLGEPEWSFPPHVWLSDAAGRTKGLVTPYGRVDRTSFGRITDPAKRRAAKEALLNQLAAVLPHAGYLTLYEHYFHQYAYDSPVDTARGLIGNVTASGALHQDVYQSLEREWNGRYLGKCDDLAEVFQNITRRQGKLSFVLGLPEHAVCGWVEQVGTRYRMQIAHTGSPRVGEGPNLEELVEAVERGFDDEGTMDFKPRSIEFLFRFAGEPVRTPYVLSCRMLVDPVYAELMERVQSYWHFHYYALGIKTMESLIRGTNGNGPDRSPENCSELSGLYRRVAAYEKAIYWEREALRGIEKKEILSWLGYLYRIARVQRYAGDHKAAIETIGEAQEELDRLPKAKSGAEGLRFVSFRIDFAYLLAELDKPWQALPMVINDAVHLARTSAQSGEAIPDEVMHCLTLIYAKMKETVQRGKRQATKAMQYDIDYLDGLLGAIYKHGFHVRSADYDRVLRRYAHMGRFYAAREGREKFLARLLSRAPHGAKVRDHANRPNEKNEIRIERDWHWIRLSPMTYHLLITEALDPLKPAKECWTEEAVKLIEAMGPAVEAARKLGVVSYGAHALLAARVHHALLTGNRSAFEKVLAEVQLRKWPRLTKSVAEALGESARFVSPSVFRSFMLLFAEHVNERCPYFHIVYAAYRGGAYEHARVAAQLALERWPGEANMKREAAYLEDLVRKKVNIKLEK